MKKKILTFVLVLFMIIPCAFGLTACGKDKNSKVKHEHTYSEEWSSDETYHWHSATCGDTSEVIDKASHTFGDVVVDTQPTGTSKGQGHKTCLVCKKTVSVDIDSWSPKGKEFIFSKYVIVAKDSTAEDWIQAKAQKDKSDMTNEQFAKWLLQNYSSTLSEISTYIFSNDSQILTQSASFSFGEGMAEQTTSKNYTYTVTDNLIQITPVGENNSISVQILNKDTIRFEEIAYGVEDNEKIILCSQYVVEGGVEPEDEEIPNPIHNHTYGSWIDEIPAGCESSGTKGHYHCDGCGKNFDDKYNEMETITISANGHTYSNDWSKNETNHWHASTCGHDVKKDENAHDLNSKGICTVCGYDCSSTLSLGYVFDADNSKGTSTAEQNTKWYAKVSLTNGTSYMATCSNINQYEVSVYDENDTKLYEFCSESEHNYVFNATYTGDYYICISKIAQVSNKPLFYISQIQNMTSPFDSESANNSATFNGGEFKVFSFTLGATCTIKLNGSFGEEDYMEIMSSDMKTIYTTYYDDINNFQTIEDLLAGTYYFIDYKTAKDTIVNYYLVCGHNFGDDNICDVCGYECTHSTTNAYDICDTCGHFLGNDVVANGDSICPITGDDGNAYYRFTLTAGTYKIVEELGEDCNGYDYYLYAEGAKDTEYTNVTSSKTVTIADEGVYYLVVAEKSDNYDEFESGQNYFQLLENITSALITNDSYTATSITNSETYYYVIDITTNGVYTFTYDEDIDGDAIDDISIMEQTAIDGSTDYKLNAGRYILKIDVTIAVNGNISINCDYSQCITTDGSLTQDLTIAHGGKVYFQINLEEGDYFVRQGSTLDIAVVFKLGGVIVGISDNFSIDENFGAGTYYIVAYNSGEDTTTGVFGII